MFLPFLDGPVGFALVDVLLDFNREHLRVQSLGVVEDGLDLVGGQVVVDVSTQVASDGVILREEVDEKDDLMVFGGVPHLRGHTPAVTHREGERVESDIRVLVWEFVNHGDRNVLPPGIEPSEIREGGLDRVEEAFVDQPIT